MLDRPLKLKLNLDNSSPQTPLSPSPANRSFSYQWSPRSPRPMAFEEFRAQQCNSLNNLDTKLPSSFEWANGLEELEGQLTASLQSKLKNCNISANLARQLSHKDFSKHSNPEYPSCASILNQQLTGKKIDHHSAQISLATAHQRNPIQDSTISEISEKADSRNYGETVNPFGGLLEESAREEESVISRAESVQENNCVHELTESRDLTTTPKGKGKVVNGREKPKSTRLNQLFEHRSKKPIQMHKKPSKLQNEKNRVLQALNSLTRKIQTLESADWTEMMRQLSQLEEAVMTKPS